MSVGSLSRGGQTTLDALTQKFIWIWVSGSNVAGMYCNVGLTAQVHTAHKTQQDYLCVLTAVDLYTTTANF